MIAPELLNHYPFFAWLESDQKQAVASVAHEIEYPLGTDLFPTGPHYPVLQIVLEGQVSLHYQPMSPSDWSSVLCEVGKGEAFGFLASFEKGPLQIAGWTALRSRVLIIDGPGINRLRWKDPGLAYTLMYQAAQIDLERLQFVRTRQTVLRANGASARILVGAPAYRKPTV